MKVGELIEALKRYPGRLKIMIGQTDNRLAEVGEVHLHHDAGAHAEPPYYSDGDTVIVGISKKTSSEIDADINAAYCNHSYGPRHAGDRDAGG